MKRGEILQKLDAAIKMRNPVLAEHYLRPGLTTKAVDKLLKRVVGLTEPIFDLYTWHDGTKFVHLAPGETYRDGIKKIEFFPGHRFHFVDLKLVILRMEELVQRSERQVDLKEGIGRYMPFFYNGSTAEFMLDTHPKKEGRVVFFDSQDGKPVREAYESLDAFLVDVLVANETGEPLRFFRGYDPGR